MPIYSDRAAGSAGFTTRHGLLLVLVLLLVAVLVTADDDGSEELAAAAAADSTPGVVWSAPIEVATGPAVVGPWRMNESDWRYVDDPSVAFDGRGGIGVTWVDHRRMDAFFQRYGPEGEPLLEEPVDVSRRPEIFTWLPRLAFASDDSEAVYVLWQEVVFSGGTHGGEAFFARSVDGGRSFETPVNLSNSPEGDGKGRLTEDVWHNGSLDVAVGPDGTVHTAWTEYEGRLWYRRSTDRGASFEPAVLVAGGEEEPPARGPSVAVGRGETVHVAWTVGGAQEADLRIATSSDGGRSFGEPRVVVPSDGHSDAPKVAVDADGTLHLVWSEAPGGMFAPSRVLYARSDDGGRSFESPRRIADGMAGDLAGTGFPSLALGSDGSVHLLWELFPERRRRPWGLGYAVSRDGGDGFTEPAVVPGTAESGLGVNGSLQGLLTRQMGVGAAGRIAVVNSRIREGEGSRVRLYLGQDTVP